MGILNAGSRAPYIPFRIYGSFLLRKGKLQITESLFRTSTVALYTGTAEFIASSRTPPRYMRASPTFILDLRPAQVILMYDLW